MTPQGEPLTREQVEAICRRAFGPEMPLLGLEQFRGGTHNQVYRVSVPGRLPLILRVAPPDAADLAWDERDLMRREQAIRPAFAALAPLMPQVVFEDFSREVIDRDYLLQTFIEGQRWDDLARELPAEASLALWAQFGSLLRQIHDTAGDYFGDPPPGQRFERWSEAVEHRLAQTAARLRGVGLEWAAQTLEAALKLTRGRRLLVDEVAVPRLLHGDLWLFNLLVRETPVGWRIVGVLDADRASWGDPLADWTMFVLAKLDAPELAAGVQRFWEAYGPVEHTRGAAFRGRLYEVAHIGTALAWAAREDDAATLARGQRELPQAAARLEEEPD